MLKIIRPSSLVDASLKEPSSASLQNTSAKRGFKSNSSAGFLRKRLSVDFASKSSEQRSSLSFLDLKDQSVTTQCSDSCTAQENSEDKSQYTKSLELQSNDLKDSLPNHIEMKCLPEKYFRVMIIGSRDIGKHSFVHSLFSTEPCMICPKKQYFDLITKVTSDDECIKRYNFWLKEPSDAQKDYRFIIDVYYRTCSVFFLMYNPQDPESLGIIDSELSLLRNTHHNLDKCEIVLVATKKSGDFPESVTLEELELIKVKYSKKSALKLLVLLN